MTAVPGPQGEPNIAARTAEAISVRCPVCGVRVEFRPIVLAVEVRSAVQDIEPTLRVSLQPGNPVAHACVKEQIVAESVPGPQGQAAEVGREPNLYDHPVEWRSSDPEGRSPARALAALVAVSTHGLTDDEVLALSALIAELQRENAELRAALAVAMKPEGPPDTSWVTLEQAGP